MKVLFVTDIHGSEVCWRKFLNGAAFYKADVIILGGDITGKVMVPIVERTGYWEAQIDGQEVRMETLEEVADAERQLRNRGWYVARVAPDELAELSNSEDNIGSRFNTEILNTMDRWLNIVDEKIGSTDIPCIVNGGNDDTPRIDKVLVQSPYVDFAEGKVIDIGGFSLASCGWTNPTPWDTYREANEETLAKKIEAAVADVPDMGRAIFNFHAPPYATGLDEAPALDSNLKPQQGGNAVVPVGSTAVREAILKHQPMLSLHGHIHESRGICKLGRTTSINPGSIYQDGVLQGVLLELNAKKAKVSRQLLING
jgi:Icc-related predicted phosphoesterase